MPMFDSWRHAGSEAHAGRAQFVVAVYGPA